MSVYIGAPLLAWAVAQIAKYVLESRKTGSFRDYKTLYASGSMPSSHSAVMVALLTVVAFTDSIDSGLFGVTAVVTVIVIYDALNVRRATGEQGIVLQKVLKNIGQNEKFFNALGHTIAEVIVGGVIGFVTAIGLLYFL